MSYPQYFRHCEQDKHYITVTVPNRQVINKITRDALESNRLYVATLAKGLSENIKELATLFREHELAISPIEDVHELWIRINMPDMPNHNNLPSMQKSVERKPSLDCEAATEGLKQLSVHAITAKYQRLPPLTTLREDDEEEQVQRWCNLEPTFELGG
jgi:hypothetical protein